MRVINMILCSLVVAVSGTAQVVTEPPADAPASRPAKAEKQEAEQTPRHDPKAVAVLASMASKVYRPRDCGVTDLACHVSIKIQAPAGPDGAPVDQEVAAFDLSWNAKKGARIDNPKGPAAARIPRDVVFELVGNDTMNQAKKQHIVYRSEKAVELHVPEWVANVQLDHMIFYADELGRPERQEVFLRGGQHALTTLFEYGEPVKKRWPVVARTIVQHLPTGDVTLTTRYEFKEIGGFPLVIRAVLENPTGGRRVVTYSDIKVNQGSPASPDSPASKPSDRTAKKSAGASDQGDR